MARDEAPPFDRGETYYGGATIDSNDLQGVSLEGMEFEFEDRDYSVQGAKTARTNRRVRVRVVRNVSGAALLPKRLVRFQKTAGVYGARVDGYTRLPAERGFPVDEWLPTAGVPANDLFYIVVRGPAVVITSLTDMGADIAVGDRVAAITAATSGATSSGRITVLGGATSGTSLAEEILNGVGYALTARTTGNTNSDVLLEVGPVF